MSPKTSWENNSWTVVAPVITLRKGGTLGGLNPWSMWMTRHGYLLIRSLVIEKILIWAGQKWVKS